MAATYVAERAGHAADESDTNYLQLQGAASLSSLQRSCRCPPARQAPGIGRSTVPPLCVDRRCRKYDLGVEGGRFEPVAGCRVTRSLNRSTNAIQVSALDVFQSRADPRDGGDRHLSAVILV